MNLIKMFQRIEKIGVENRSVRYYSLILTFASMVSGCNRDRKVDQLAQRRNCNLLVQLI
ncbi:hypothetical protein [Paenibacillus paridis]|uniref:hypothetical protein n=1 Tax=Paenibacillus paridis TaxID=2583376 RepID=UPI001390851A|nr:hypothetical protein [Paenibacillus paridis]